jgi:hypothetical protein
MEYKQLTEQQQTRATGINAMIARGVMPTAEQLLGAGRHVLMAGCPEALLRSVVAKNAVVTRSRPKRGLKLPAGQAARIRARLYSPYQHEGESVAAWKQRCRSFGICRIAVSAPDNSSAQARRRLLLLDF